MKENIVSLCFRRQSRPHHFVHEEWLLLAALLLSGGILLIPLVRPICASAQTLSVACSDVTLKECLKRVTTTTGVSVLAPEAFLSRTVSVTVKKTNLVSALLQIAEASQIKSASVTYDQASKQAVISFLDTGAGATVPPGATRTMMPTPEDMQKTIAKDTDAAHVVKTFYLPGGAQISADEMKARIREGETTLQAISTVELPDGQQMSKEHLQEMIHRDQFFGNEDKPVSPDVKDDKTTYRQLRQTLQRDELKSGDPNTILRFPGGAEMTQAEFKKLIEKSNGKNASTGEKLPTN